MKSLKFLMIALVAMLGFISCDKDDCNHYDHSADLVGTWTCLQENFAEALVISADGSMVATGLADGKYWEDVKGTITLKDGKAILNFEDNVTVEGHFDIIPGMAFSIVTDNGERMTFNYCANDLSDEIVGMWVCNDAMNSMRIHSFENNGNAIFTGWDGYLEKYSVLENSKYKVVGDLIFQGGFNNDSSHYIVAKLMYTPNGTSYGDIMSFKHYIFDGEESTQSWLRVKQGLNLAGKNYDYSKMYLSNVKGLDKDIEFMGYTMNFATLDGTGLNKMLKTILFNIQFPDAETMRYSGHYNGVEQFYNAPIAVEGNKITIKMSEKIPTLKDVEFYAFKDADDCQLHLYMHKTAFINFYTNVQARLMANMDTQFDITDAESINAIYSSINNAVETINLSLVMTESTKAL